ncbi:MAG: dihydrolipoamide acetyltransferase family protein, partial [Polyangiales bacterium]
SAAVTAPAAAPVSAPASGSGVGGGRILSSPLVRRLARERSIDLRTVEGSGPHGRVVKRDIESHPGAAVAGRSTGAERLPPRVETAGSTRRTIARRLTESKQNVPHYYLTIDVDIGPLADARAAMNAELETSGRKVSLNDLIIKAVAAALRRVPEVNASWMGKEIHHHQVVDISVAVAIDDGLMTPVIRDADRKGVAQIAEEVRDLAARAREKRLQPEEMTNGTFSISNLGMFGIEEFAAVINPPEGAILAVGALRREPVVEGDQIVPGRRMRFTMSCDHRVIDGATGARFLAAFKRIVESPLNMLL